MAGSRPCVCTGVASISVMVTKSINDEIQYGEAEGARDRLHRLGEVFQFILGKTAVRRVR